MRTLALLLLVAVPACSEVSLGASSAKVDSAATEGHHGSGSDDAALDDFESDDDDAPGKKTGSDADDDDDSSKPPPPPCDDAETAKLQTALDGAHKKGSNAVLSVKTPCGIRFFTSGPSKYGAKVLHHIASVTKTYTGAIIVTLAKEGKLKLSDRVSKWVANIPNGDAITIEQLLRHRSGLFNYTEDSDFYDQNFNDPHRAWSPQELIDVAAKNGQVFAPGTDFGYSNTNFVVAGLVAENVSGTTLTKLIRTRILDRLGLKETFIATKESTAGFELAEGIGENGKVISVPDESSSASFACADMVATPSDMARWFEKLGNGEFYNDAATQALVMKPSEAYGDGADSGLAFFLMGPTTTNGGGRGIDHEGSYEGYHSTVQTFPEKKTTLAMVIDADGEDPFDTADSVRRVLFAK